jgi:hypothetical protein
MKNGNGQFQLTYEIPNTQGNAYTAVAEIAGLKTSASNYAIKIISLQINSAGVMTVSIIGSSSSLFEYVYISYIAFSNPNTIGFTTF